MRTDQNKFNRKLTLARETIRELTDQEMSRLAGGASKRCYTNVDQCLSDFDCVPDTFITCARSRCFGCR